MRHATQTKEVTKEQLKAKLDGKKSFVLLNVLEPEGYSLGVILGSRKIPLAQLGARIEELDRSKDVVTYCANTGCDASHKAAELLADKGFNVSVYKGGAEEWSAAGFPVEDPAPTPESKAAEARLADDGNSGTDSGAEE